MSTTRRHFLGAAAAALASPQFSAAQGRSANDRIQIALIGAGGMGNEDLANSMAAGAKVVAASDVYDGRLEHIKESHGSDVFTTRDYREVLARKDVDAVIVATPDHWHSTITIDALKAGKDVYCEKPMVQHIEDGAGVVAAQKQTGRIVQVGSQRVSSIVYQKAKELIAQGAIGELNMVEAWWDRNSAIGAWQYTLPLDASPATIDWDRFLGRAPKVPFEPIRLFRWRNYRDYGTGVAGDLFVHLFSGLHYILGSIGPTRVFATGGLRFWKDGRDVPDVMLGLYDYPAGNGLPAFNLTLRVNFVSGVRESSGFRFVGSEGILTLGDGVTLTRQPRETEPGFTIETFANATQEQFLKDYKAKYPAAKPVIASMRAQADEHFHAPPGYSDHLHHHRNFLDSVRSRKLPVEDAVFGFRAASPALLSLVSHFDRKVCSWDPRGMTPQA